MEKEILKKLQSLKNPEKSATLQRFFKTKKGEYGEGDVFLGITVPETRKIAHEYAAKISLPETERLLHSKYHEARLAALLILVEKYKKGEKGEEVFNLYIQNTNYINNWDLVDSSAYFIVGSHLEGKNKKLLEKFACSKNLWEKRIAMISTFHFIRKGSTKEAFQIAKILLKDKHDLIHKAVGWMLREAGKHCSRVELEAFLKKHKKEMPRTALRYTIEHFSEQQRKEYLATKQKGD